ncbi:NUDIX hydrolase [Candidatus Woesearchaeota archaeon]|nr:NUDIX hydrolase [Candidatus Woesearchaeota archaeon]
MPVGRHVEEQETFDKALRRELKEETNLSAKIISYYPPTILSSSLNNPFFIFADNDETILEYIGFIEDFSVLKIEENEIDDVRCFSKEELASEPFLEHIKEKALFALDCLTK